MPYFIYKIFPEKQLEPITYFEKYPDAKRYARSMRSMVTPQDNYNVKIMFAKNQLEAEMLLKEKRAPHPGDD